MARNYGTKGTPIWEDPQVREAVRGFTEYLDGVYKKYRVTFQKRDTGLSTTASFNDAIFHYSLDIVVVDYQAYLVMKTYVVERFENIENLLNYAAKDVRSALENKRREYIKNRLPHRPWPGDLNDMVYWK